MVKFSVIINNCNYGRFVGQAMESVLEQTLSDFELIVVDDGSTDDSRQVISSFRDSRIRHSFQANGGQGSAFLTGISIAKGDLIALLDSDDEWHPTKLARCADVMAAHGGISLLQHGWDVIDENGGQEGCHRLPIAGPYDPMPDYRDLRFDLPFAPTSCVVGSTAAFRRLRLDPSAWRIAADTPVIAGLSVLGGCYMIPDPLTSYRRHGHGAESKNSWWQIIDRRRRYYDCVNEHLDLIGSRERFRFENSETYLRGRIATTKWYQPQGLWSRMRYLCRAPRSHGSHAASRQLAQPTDRP